MRLAASDRLTLSDPRGDPWPLVEARLDDIVPLSVARMTPPRDGFDAGRIAPFMPRRADWLSAVPEGCWTRYAGTMKFGGYDD